MKCYRCGNKLYDFNTAYISTRVNNRFLFNKFNFFHQKTLYTFYNKMIVPDILSIDKNNMYNYHDYIGCFKCNIYFRKDNFKKLSHKRLIAKFRKRIQ